MKKNLFKHTADMNKYFLLTILFLIIFLLTPLFLLNECLCDHEKEICSQLLILLKETQRFLTF